MRPKNPYLVAFQFMIDSRQRDKLAEIAKGEQRSTGAKLRMMVDDEIVRAAYEHASTKRAA
jgi:hypothetical protein